MGNNKKGFSFGKNRKSVGHTNMAERKLTSKTPFRVVEAYKALRTKVQFSLAATENQKVIIVSSPSPGEGKSTTCANLAITFAQTGAKILIIDADLRKPTQQKIFRVDNSTGLSRLLAGFESLADSLKREVQDGVDLITSGPTPPNPAELLGSNNMDILLEKLKEHYDYIFIDTPPVNVVTDALVLSQKAAGVMLVARHQVTTYEELQDAVETVKFAQSNILGIVIGAVAEKSVYGGGAYKSYRYKRYDYAEYGKN